LTAGHDVVVPQLLAHPGFLSELAAAAAESGAQFVAVMVWVEKDQSLERYSNRWRVGDDPVHGAADAPNLEEIGRTYDRLVAFAASRDVAKLLPSGTSDEMYQALLTVLQDCVR
jgi:hypothetical protein